MPFVTRASSPRQSRGRPGDRPDTARPGFARGPRDPPHVESCCPSQQASDIRTLLHRCLSGHGLCPRANVSKCGREPVLTALARCRLGTHEMKSSEATRKKGGSRPKRCLLKKQIAGALVASLLIGSAPGWAQDENATAKPAVEENAQRQQFRDSIDRAIDRSMESEPPQATAGVVPKEPSASGPQLTAHERRDLNTRRAALQTDPVARGTGGIVLALVSVAVTIGVTAWAIHHYSKDNTTTAAMMGRR
jgi:hypothetical protein